MTMSSRSYGVGVAALAIVFTGCVAYIPTELETVPAGANVRIFLTSTRMAEIREIDDQGLPDQAGSTTVNGTFVRHDDTVFGVRIPIASRDVGFLRSRIARELTFSASEVLQVQLREVNRGKSALAIAASTGLLTFLVVAMLSGAENRSQAPTGEIPEASRIPLALSSLFRLFGAGDASRAFPTTR